MESLTDPQLTPADQSQGATALRILRRVVRLALNRAQMWRLAAWAVQTQVRQVPLTRRPSTGSTGRSLLYHGHHSLMALHEMFPTRSSRLVKSPRVEMKICLPTNRRTSAMRFSRQLCAALPPQAVRRRRSVRRGARRKRLVEQRVPQRVPTPSPRVMIPSATVSMPGH